MSKQFGDRLKELRDAAGMSQTELAKKSGLNQSTISQWEKGSMEPAWSAVMGLSAALGVSCEAFRLPAEPLPAKAKRLRKPKSS